MNSAHQNSKIDLDNLALIEEMLNFQDYKIHQAAPTFAAGTKNDNVSGGAGLSMTSQQLKELNNELQLQNILQSNHDNNEYDNILLSAKGAYNNSNLQTQQLAQLANWIQISSQNNFRSIPQSILQSQSQNQRNVGSSGVSEPSKSYVKNAKRQNQNTQKEDGHKLINYPQSIENMKQQNPQNRNSFEENDSANVKLSKTQNQKLVKELMELKEEINNLKKMQNDVTIQNNYSSGGGRGSYNQIKQDDLVNQKIDEISIENQYLKQELQNYQNKFQEQQSIIESQQNKIQELQQLVNIMGSNIQQFLNQKSNQNQQNQDFEIQQDQENELFINPQNQEIEKENVGSSQNLQNADENKQKREIISQFLNDNQIASTKNQKLFGDFQNQFYINDREFAQKINENQENLNPQMIGPLSLQDIIKIQSNTINQTNKNQSKHFFKKNDQNFNSNEALIQGFIKMNEINQQSSKQNHKNHKRPASSQNFRGSQKPYREAFKIQKNQIPQEINAMQPDFDSHMIQQLFPDRAIKAQNFIDLISCNRKNQRQHSFRLQNLQKLSQDVEWAVKDLIAKLKEKNINLNLKKSDQNNADPFIYQLELPEPKTSGLKPRSARNRFGAPYSHLPKDKILSQKIKLSLSGGVLMIQTGGGFRDILEFLETKGYFSNSPFIQI